MPPPITNTCPSTAAAPISDRGVGNGGPSVHRPGDTAATAVRAGRSPATKPAATVERVLRIRAPGAGVARPERVLSVLTMKRRGLAPGCLPVDAADRAIGEAARLDG